ncbi:LysM peptidoglycan-binding domain-containing protein [Gordonia aichiensis]|uniref:LysM peptidoglycan-binding domain-containing protein n=2 Tax=Gordonia TaxID=2053 RepID=UPI0032647F78
MGTKTATAPAERLPSHRQPQSRVYLTRDLPVCFPSGRPERRGRAALPAAERSRLCSEAVSAFEEHPVFGEHPDFEEYRLLEQARHAAAVRRRRRWGAFAVGGTLAAVVWVLALVGAGYEDAMTPATPSSTQVVYVRAGESLSSLAQRLAPDLPPAGVISQLREINGLQTSGLTVGQALIAPRYR